MAAKKVAKKPAIARKPAASAKQPKSPAKKPAAVNKSNSKSVQPARKAASAVKTPAKKAGAPRKQSGLDFDSFPPESIIHEQRMLCLACVLDVFTRHLGLSASTAQTEIARYTPSLDELKANAPVRPYFAAGDAKAPCPHCGAAPKWHAKLDIHRIESGKATDAPRRALLKALPAKGFSVVEEKGTQQHAFFEWLDHVSQGLDLDEPVWIREVSRHYLSRIEPKTDWNEPLDQTHTIRRSRRLESGWEVDSGRLFVAPMMFDELLAVHYLVSRSHKAGGLTLEGRYTLPELISRLRHSGYLRHVGVTTHNPSDALEQLISHLGGGEGSLKFYYIVDRRDLLDTLKKNKLLTPPKRKPAPVLA